MKPSDHDIMVERVRQTFDLFDAGVSMMLARFRREHPDADEAEIERLLCSWLSTAPGVTHGDDPGVSRAPDEAST